MFRKNLQDSTAKAIDKVRIGSIEIFLKMKKTIVLEIGLILMTAFSAAIGQGKFECQLSSDSITAGNYIKLTYNIENLDGKLEVPDFKGVEVVSGPNTSSQMSIMNGLVSKKIKYDYIIYVEKVGDLYLSPAYLVSDEKTWEIDPIKVVVTFPKEPVTNPKIEEGKPFRVSIEVDENGMGNKKEESSKKKRVLRRI